MDRRAFISGTLAGGFAASAIPTIALAKNPSINRHTAIRITTRVSIAKDAGPSELWMPTFAQTDWQKPLSRVWTGQADTIAMPDNTGSTMLRAKMDTNRRNFTLSEDVTTWFRSPEARAARLSPAERDYWTAEEGSDADKGAIKAMARKITQRASSDMEKARAIYDWIVTNSWRDSSVKACGKRQVVGMLRSGEMGGKCADINGMTVCLARASGIPARENFGIRHSPSLISTSMGANSADITGAQHCRAEIFLEGMGWFAIDPADVRKVMLQEKLPLKNPRIAQLQQRLFGHAEGNRASYNSQTGPKLSQSLATEFDFLMYPTALGADGQLGPDALSYEITAQAIPA